MGVGTANPPARYAKAECLVAFERSAWFARLDGRAHLLARAVLQRDNGIEARRLAVEWLDDVFTIDRDTLSRRFLAHAPLLAAQAGARAMIQVGLDASQSCENTSLPWCVAVLRVTTQKATSLSLDVRIETRLKHGSWQADRQLTTS